MQIFRNLVVLGLVAGLVAGQPATFDTQATMYPGAAANGGFSVSSFQSASTPGNVGVCFSGGGSRAMSAAMGQLRAFSELGYLSQIKAISSVSGGSWASVPFTFLPQSISDADFLGPYVADPADLHVTSSSGPTVSQLDSVTSPQNLGAAVVDNNMSLLSLAAQAVSSYLNGVPANRLWTHAIGTNILGTFGLASFDATTNLPTKFFCPNQATCAAIAQSNPNYSGYDMVRPGRPFLIVNSAMFVNLPNINPSFSYLVPFQATPYFAGIVATPPGAINPTTGNQVGGAGISSYAFNSLYSSSGANGAATVTQTCPFALSDITGMSSAAIAEVLKNDVAQSIASAPDLDPQFNYFSPADVAAGSQGGLATFSDAGTLDNSGVCGMLVYNDIDTLIVFVNTDTPLSQDSNGNVILTESLAPLFGYQDYSSTDGYVAAPPPSQAWSNTDMTAEFRFNQVFESSQFSALQQGLLAATTNNGQSPVSTAPCVFLQSGLSVQANPWWGIAGGNTVNVLWVYNQAASDWQSQLSFDVSLTLVGMNFPWYSTADTGLDATHVNLLAHFSCWVVMQSANTIEALFQPAGYLQDLMLATGMGKSQIVGAAVGASVGAVLLAFGVAVFVARLKRRALLLSTATSSKEGEEVELGV